MASTCNKATMALLTFVVPITYISMIAGGAVATFTDRDNPSVEQTWTFCLVFLFSFVFLALISIGMTLKMYCSDDPTTNAHLLTTIYWLAWVFVSAFLGGLVWWYRNKDYTNDLYQSMIANYLWSGSLATAPIVFLYPVFLWGQMSQ